MNSITVLFRPTNTKYQVIVNAHSTIENVITDVCHQAQKYIKDDCYYLWYNSNELNNNDNIYHVGLYPTCDTIQNLPEVRLKYIQLLEANLHVGKQLFLASPERIDYNKLFKVSSSSNKNQIIAPVLKNTVQQIVKYTSSDKQDNTILIPLPIFSRQLIDSLPTINLTVPLSPKEFDWNIFLQQLADDLEIDRTDLIITNVQEGSTKFKIRLRPKINEYAETIKKVAKKLCVMCLPKCEKLVANLKSSITSSVKEIRCELENFSEETSSTDTDNMLLDDIDNALRLSERPAIIDECGWNFLAEKNRQLTIGIIQSIQSSEDEYIIDRAALIYNEQISDVYQNSSNIDKNEKILFHGTSTVNFDGIFEKNFQYESGAKRTDKGWYGRGIYFSNSPKKALNYAKSKTNVSYLICSFVRLGKMLTVTDFRFKDKPMESDYDSHYIPIRADGFPISNEEIPVYEEYVVKNSSQIMPLYIIGLLKVSCFVIWRDAKITNEANSSIFENMKQRFHFNIYGTQTSLEALNILRVKLTNESMKCVVVTNGTDDGEGFVRDCRSIRSSLPVVVYCKNKSYHQQWADTLAQPEIHVTTSPDDVFDFILLNNRI